MKYFIKLNDEPQGPMTAEQIRLRMAEGAYKEDDLVRREDSEEWKPIKQMKEFAEALGSSTPVKNPLAWMCLTLGLSSPLILMVSPREGWGLCLIAVLLAILCGHLAGTKISSNYREVNGRIAVKCGLWIAYLLLFGAPLLETAYCQTAGRSEITRGINNCHEIITALKVYALDVGGKYPDATLVGASNSNQIFHILFTHETLVYERIFGCPNSPFIPDGKIGVAPDYLEAVKPGENHWAMTKGLTDGLHESSTNKMPIVFENPSEDSWPPKWNASPNMESKPGRSWAGGKVIIGMNDSSVRARPLSASVGTNLELMPDADGTPVFPLTSKREILNVAK